MIEAVLQATLISKCVLVLLLFMSVSSWAYMCGKWLALRSAQSRTQKLNGQAVNTLVVIPFAFSLR
ncbi:hypothetical protein V6C07_03020 [Desulfovibrio sp. 1214_IL3152]